MPPPPRITEWIRQAYPKPTVDPEWLEACLAWISEELNLNDVDSQVDEIISNVDSQLLNSDLHDSMLAGTGFPHDIGAAEDARLQGNILVQIQGMTEIGHSAFSLQNVQQTRTDRVDLAGLAGDGEEDEGPIPKFPRSMLRFDLSDGSQSIRAIEYRRLPELELGSTPLGYKMILKDVPIRRGIAFLEPSNVVLKGCMTEELDANREADFARGLRLRLGQPEPEPNEETLPHSGASQNLPPPPVGTGVPGSRAPLQDVTADTPTRSRPNPREQLEPPTRRRVPASSASSSNVVSPYFSSVTSSATLVSTNLASVRLSPVGREPLPSRTLSHQMSTGGDSSDFSDDMHVDEAFLQELETAEQAAMSTVQEHNGDARQASNAFGVPDTAAVGGHSEVIVIDSDSDDKENLAPFVERRVRRRIATPDANYPDVIVIE